MFCVIIKTTKWNVIRSKYSFRLLTRADIKKIKKGSKDPVSFSEKEKEDKRSFLKLAGLVGLGLAATQLLPKKAEALVFGGTPSATTVGIKNSSNSQINPATEETVSELQIGLKVQKKSVLLNVTDAVHAPTSGKKIRIYNMKFSLSADLTSISFRFTSGGTDFEKYLVPKAGGLYGANNQPNYYEGGVDESLYCVISGTGTVQINLDYLEV